MNNCVENLFTVNELVFMYDVLTVGYHMDIIFKTNSPWIMVVYQKYKIYAYNI